jgi:hypothetical protein
VAWSRLENVPSVASTAPEVFSTWICNVSFLSVVVVSAVSMCSQKLNVAVVAVAGMVTVWVAESVWVLP